MATSKDRWTVSALEEILPPTRRTFSKYLADVKPVEIIGKNHYYKLVDVLKAMPPHLLGITPIDGEALDLNAESARLKKSQADKSELDVAVMRKELLPIELTREIWMDRTLKFRSKMLSIPTIASGQVAGLDVLESKKLLEDLILQALDELKDYDPEAK